MSVERSEKYYSEIFNQKGPSNTRLRVVRLTEIGLGNKDGKGGRYCWHALVMIRCPKRSPDMAG